MVSRPGKLRDNLNIPIYRRPTKSVRIDSVMSPRKRNRNRERTMSFLNDNSDWVNATVLVGLDGKPIDMELLVATQEAILDELRELNQNLSTIGD